MTLWKTDLMDSEVHRSSTAVNHHITVAYAQTEHKGHIMCSEFSRMPSKMYGVWQYVNKVTVSLPDRIHGSDLQDF